ncbi:hypothetical protein PUN28_011929 [Cardiocondyla obscurior]|uniref:Uncharacterized protein n=1 Tax=Cardiocondyla obscurior TaxID=286306 RepID=A0AAW2F9L5_9HYME
MNVVYFKVRLFFSCIILMNKNVYIYIHNINIIYLCYIYFYKMTII